MMYEYYPEGWNMDTPENRTAMQNFPALNEACRDGRILEGRALVCDSSHNLIVDLGCMKGIISRVNRPLCCQVTGFEKAPDGSSVAVLSRRAAQEKCVRQRVSALRSGDVIDARITHLESFGAFADIGCGIVALLPIDSISISRIDHPRERFTPGMDIRAVIRTIENGRITLSHKELLGTWEENAAQFAAGETVAGIVRSVEPYGVFVELTPNLAGLAEGKEGAVPGQQASVYIKSIIPTRMKIKLVMIDTFDFDYRPSAPKYYFTGSHMDRFVYSPECCARVVASRFPPEV